MVRFIPAVVFIFCLFIESRWGFQSSQRNIFHSREKSSVKFLWKNWMNNLSRSCKPLFKRFVGSFPHRCDYINWLIIYSSWRLLKKSVSSSMSSCELFSLLHVATSAWSLDITWPSVLNLILISATPFRNRSNWGPQLHPAGSYSLVRLQPSVTYDKKLHLILLFFSQHECRRHEVPHHLWWKCDVAKGKNQNAVKFYREQFNLTVQDNLQADREFFKIP